MVSMVFLVLGAILHGPLFPWLFHITVSLPVSWSISSTSRNNRLKLWKSKIRKTLNRKKMCHQLGIKEKKWSQTHSEMSSLVPLWRSKILNKKKNTGIKKKQYEQLLCSVQMCTVFGLQGSACEKLPGLESIQCVPILTSMLAGHMVLAESSSHIIFAAFREKLCRSWRWRTEACLTAQWGKTIPGSRSASPPAVNQVAASLNSWGAAVEALKRCSLPLVREGVRKTGHMLDN